MWKEEVDYDGKKCLRSDLLEKYQKLYEEAESAAGAQAQRRKMDSATLHAEDALKALHRAYPLADSVAAANFLSDHDARTKLLVNAHCWKHSSQPSVAESEIQKLISDASHDSQTGIGILSLAMEYLNALERARQHVDAVKQRRVEFENQLEELKRAKLEINASKAAKEAEQQERLADLASASVRLHRLTEFFLLLDIHDADFIELLFNTDFIRRPLCELSEMAFQVLHFSGCWITYL